MGRTVVPPTVPHAMERIRRVKTKSLVTKPGHRLHASDVSCAQLALFPQSHCQHVPSKCILRTYAQTFVVIQNSLLQFSLQSNTNLMPLNS